MIKVNMEVLYEERLKDIQKSALEKAKILAANPGYDQPILKERLYTSMIWGDYDFLGNPELESDESNLLIIDNSSSKDVTSKSITQKLNSSRKIKKGMLSVLKFNDDFMLNDSESADNVQQE